MAQLLELTSGLETVLLCEPADNKEQHSSGLINHFAPCVLQAAQVIQAVGSVHRAFQILTALKQVTSREAATVTVFDALLHHLSQQTATKADDRVQEELNSIARGDNILLCGFSVDEKAALAGSPPELLPYLAELVHHGFASGKTDEVSNIVATLQIVDSKLIFLRGMISRPGLGIAALRLARVLQSTSPLCQLKGLELFDYENVFGKGATSRTISQQQGDVLQAWHHMMYLHPGLCCESLIYAWLRCEGLRRTCNWSAVLFQGSPVAHHLRSFMDVVARALLKQPSLALISAVLDRADNIALWIGSMVQCHAGSMFHIFGHRQHHWWEIASLLLTFDCTPDALQTLTNLYASTAEVRSSATGSEREAPCLYVQLAVTMAQHGADSLGDTTGAVSLFFQSTRHKCFRSEALDLLRILPHYNQRWRQAHSVRAIATLFERLGEQESFLTLATACQRVPVEQAPSAAFFLKEWRRLGRLNPRSSLRGLHFGLGECLGFWEVFRVKSAIWVCLRVLHNLNMATQSRTTQRVALCILAAVSGAETRFMPPDQAMNALLALDVLIVKSNHGAVRDRCLVAIGESIVKRLEQLIRAVRNLAEERLHALTQELTALLTFDKLVILHRYEPRTAHSTVTLSRPVIDLLASELLTFVCGLNEMNVVDSWEVISDAASLAGVLACWWGGRSSPSPHVDATCLILSGCADAFHNYLRLSTCATNDELLTAPGYGLDPTSLLGQSNALMYNTRRAHSLESSSWSILHHAMLRACFIQQFRHTDPALEELAAQKGLQSALLHAYTTSLSESAVHTRFIPLPPLFTTHVDDKPSVLFRGLGNRDGKERSVSSIIDLLTFGLSAADLSTASPLGQSSSKSGQIFLTHCLKTATHYLSEGFDDGALVAINVEYVNSAILLQDYRLEKENVFQIALYHRVPLNAIAAIFLPDSFEADLCRLRDGIDNVECDHEETRSIDEYGRDAIQKNLTGSTDGYAHTSPLFTRLHFYSNDRFSDFETFVESVLLKNGFSLCAQGKIGFDHILPVAAQCETTWAVHGPKVAEAYIPMILASDLLPKSLRQTSPKGFLQ
eukprot:5111377-Prymnesium_polylepis.1